MNRSRTYLDWNATAPLRPEARAAMLAALDLAGNASSVHAEGRRVRRIVEEAREAVAALVGAGPGDVIFTSGATEANATVLASGWDWIAAAPIEHDSVLAALEVSGARWAALGVAVSGRVEVRSLAGLPSERIGLASLHVANNETGVLQPVAELAGQAKAAGTFVHTDATQAVGRTPVDMRALGADYLTCSAHKIGGPKGIGALVVRETVPLRPLLRGGRQERNRRAGTENVAAIAGFAAAAAAARSDLAGMEKVARLRDRLEADVLGLTPEAIVIGREVARIPNTSLIALPGRLAETLVAALDLSGIAVSSGSACSSGKVTQSRVLDAMGFDADVSRSAIRVSLGSTTTEQDIAAFIAAWSRITKVAARAA